MVNIKYGADAPTVKGKPSSQDFTVSFVETPWSYAEQSAPIPMADGAASIIYPAYTTETEPSVVVSGDSSGLSISLLPWDDTETSPTVNLVGGAHLQRVFTKNARAHVEVKTNYGARRFRATFNTVDEDEFGSTSFISQPSYREGTLAYDCTQNTLNLFRGFTAGYESNSMFLNDGNYSLTEFSVQDNPSFIGASLDFSGVSVARSGVADPGAPYTLISPRHAIFAAHTDGSTVGKQVLFRRPDGSTQTVTVTGEARFPPIGPDAVDLALVHFNAPVTGCRIYRVLPSDWERYLPSQAPNRGYDAFIQLPAICRAFNTGTTTPGAASSNLFINNISPKLIAQCLLYLGVDEQLSMTTGVLAVYPKWQELVPHYRAVYPGDSGSPTFILVRPSATGPVEPVLIGALYAISFQNALSPHVAGKFSWVESQMNSLASAAGDSTTYNLQVIDLSRFTTF